MLKLLILLTVLSIAVVSDLWSQKIPNWLTYPAMALGITYHSTASGWGGLFFSLKGMGLGIALMILPYIIGQMGAGDAKLMGAVGGLLGAKGVFVAFLFTSILGGVYALVLLILHGHLKETLKRYLHMLRTFLVTGRFFYIPAPSVKRPKLCYGLAIAAGTLCSLFLAERIEFLGR
ncbi:MAG: A24 family peptidase [Thermodesulfobacteriota bacterium]